MIIWKFLTAKPLATIAMVFILGLVTKLAITEHKLNQVEAEADSLALVTYNLEAAADTTRELFNILGDSIRVFARLAEQHRIENDSLADSLGVEVLSQQNLMAQINSLDTLARGDTVRVDSIDVRVGHWDLREPPYTIVVTASLPPPPARSILDLSIRLDLIEFTGRVTCGEAVGRVRPAEVILTGPSWVQFTLKKLEQDPAICNPSVQIAGSSGSLIRDLGIGAASGIIVATLLNKHPLIGLGIGGGVGLGWHFAF